MYKFKVKDLSRKDKELKKLMKKCTKCKELKLIYNFRKNKNKKDGLNQECKKCYNNRYTHICKQCGEEFKNGKKESKFCSRTCMGEFYQNQIEFKCEYCGKLSQDNKIHYDMKKHHYCSNECKFNALKNQIEFKCEYCGSVSSLAVSQYNKFEHHYCSKECSNLANAKKGENNPNWNPNKTDEEREIERSYNEYYEWRKQIFKRDDYTCQCCRIKGGNLVAHHLNGYNWDKEHRTNELNGIVLCEECHKEFHSIYGKGNNTIEQFREFLYNKYLQTKDIKYLVALEDTDIRKYAMTLKEG